MAMSPWDHIKVCDTKSHRGHYDLTLSGGQAEYVKVPWADFNALLLPPGTDNEADFILLAE